MANLLDENYILPNLAKHFATKWISQMMCECQHSSSIQIDCFYKWLENKRKNKYSIGNCKVTTKLWLTDQVGNLASHKISLDVFVNKLILHKSKVSVQIKKWLSMHILPSSLLFWAVWNFFFFLSQPSTLISTRFHLFYPHLWCYTTLPWLLECLL